MQTKRIVVVGAGPSGMMAAIRASQLNQEVILCEKNSIPGRKLFLSGKGRCNLTNACNPDLFLKRFSKNGEFLRNAFGKFFNQDLINFFKARGLELKTERQLRVFPVTDSSASVIEVLKKELIKNKVRIIYKAKAKGILAEGNTVKGVSFESAESISCSRVILGTGGVSYSFTGSSGEGLMMAQKLGHKIVPLRPGLVSLRVKEKYPKILEGLTLKNIRIKFYNGKKEIVSEVGELVFTETGISGPLVLTLSGRIIDWLEDKKEVYPVRNLGLPHKHSGISNGVYAEIDLKPGLSPEQLDGRLLREFKIGPKKNIKNIMKSLLPLKLADLIMGIAKVKPAQKANQITHDERRRISVLLKGWRLNITGSGSIEEGMVTRGGVSLKEINPATMESRLIHGLYFCGEMIDVDADTGGFNLQAAFSTGYLAGESAALN